MNERYSSKAWKVTSCIKCNKARPYQEPKSGLNYTYCQSCLRQAQLGPYRPHIEDPYAREYDKW